MDTPRRPSTEHAAWHKATASSGTGGCVEVAILEEHGLVAVRDSKDPARTPHFHSREAWTAFTDLLRERGTTSLATDHLRVEVDDNGITLHTLTDATPAHRYTHHEWQCFLDGIRHCEPQLTCA
jgi:hypothetical protein